MQIIISTIDALEETQGAKLIQKYSCAETFKVSRVILKVLPIAFRPIECMVAAIQHGSTYLIYKGIMMKYSVLIAVLAGAITLSACQKKETVVVPVPEPTPAPSTTVVPVPVPVPGPAGPAGSPGPQGEPGAPGASAVIPTPAPAVTPAPATEEKKP